MQAKYQQAQRIRETKMNFTVKTTKTTNAVAINATKRGYLL